MYVCIWCVYMLCMYYVVSFIFLSLDKHLDCSFFLRGKSLFHLISYSTLWMVVRTGNQTWTWRQALKKRSWRNRITILCRLISYSSCSGMALAIVNHQSRKYSMIFCLLDNLMETFSQLKFPFSVWLLLDYIWFFKKMRQKNKERKKERMGEKTKKKIWLIDWWLIDWFSQRTSSWFGWFFV